MNRTSWLYPITFIGLMSCSAGQTKMSMSDTESADFQTVDSIEYRHLGEQTHYMWLAYHSNGRVKAVGEQNDFNGCGIEVGSQLHFSHEGKLIKIIHFDNWLRNDQGCEESIVQNRTVTEYRSDGTLLSIKHFQRGYQTEDFPCGQWQVYDVSGALRETVYYPYQWLKKGQ